MNEERRADKIRVRTTDNIEVWHEILGTERITVVKTAKTTTRISRNKLHDAMQRIVREPAMRARLEAHPVDAMAEMGIELDDKEKSAIAGRRLSEVLAFLSKADPAVRGAVGFFPESIIEVVIGTISTGPLAQAVQAATSETEALVGVETAAEEAVVVITVI